jgi:His/Glu/Gln/Arg/opine family amino acid ABC transporter permease subunit
VNYQFEWYLITRNWHPIVLGAWITYLVAVLSMALALVLGLMLALMRVSHIRSLASAASAYIEVMRALPLYAFLLWIYYGLAVAVGISFEPITAGCLALGLVTAAYVAEIYRAGVLTITHGQFEAARALGLDAVAVYRDIVIPQATRVILPAAGNQFVGVLKGAAVVSVIGVPDLMFYANWASLRYFKPFEFYTVAGVILIGSTVGIAAIVAAWERRMRWRR